jgi:hypothetical protein
VGAAQSSDASQRQRMQRKPHPSPLLLPSSGADSDGETGADSGRVTTSAPLWGQVFAPKSSASGGTQAVPPAAAASARNLTRPPPAHPPLSSTPGATRSAPGLHAAGAAEAAAATGCEGAPPTGSPGVNPDAVSALLSAAANAALPE